MAYGIAAYGGHVPSLRLTRAAIAAAHSWMSGPKKLPNGTRAFCNWDEDAVTMAVEAARECLAHADRTKIAGVDFISATPPYATVQHAAIVAAGMGLPANLRVTDVAGSARSAVGRLAEVLAAPDGERVLVASDRPVAKMGSAQELSFGAGAAAFRLGAESAIAVFRGRASTTALFFDRFRPEGEDFEYQWEERWIRDEGYAKLVPEAVTLALANAGLELAEIQHLAVASPLSGVAAATMRKLGFAGRLADSLDSIGYAGVAHPLLMLADALDHAEPGQRIMVVGFGQGVDVLIIETTNLIADHRRPVLAPHLERGLVIEDYLRMAAHYGLVELDFGMRAERVIKPALTEQYRSAGQLLPFVAGECGSCGTVQFPQLAYCVNPQCNASSDGFAQHSLADEPAKVMMFTADWLTFHPAPPLYIGFAEFRSGARLIMEMVDVAPGQIEIGLQMRAVFRVKERDAQRGYNRYFWKLAPAL